MENADNPSHVRSQKTNSSEAAPPRRHTRGPVPINTDREWTGHGDSLRPVRLTYGEQNSGLTSERERESDDIT